MLYRESSGKRRTEKKRIKKKSEPKIKRRVKNVGQMYQLVKRERNGRYLYKIKLKGKIFDNNRIYTTVLKICEDHVVNNCIKEIKDFWLN